MTMNHTLKAKIDSESVRDRIPFGYIYCITSLDDGQQYVGLHKSREFDKNYFGSPSSLSKGSLRYRYQKIWPSNNNRGYAIPSLEEYEKYFKIEVLEWCYSSDDLFDQEKKWIIKYDSVKRGMNRITGAGKGSVCGDIYSKYCEVCSRETKWKSGQCYSCANRDCFYTDNCLIHGENKFKHGRCQKCFVLEQVAVKYCNKCKKEMKHRGFNCYGCRNTKSIKYQKCDIHGKTKFIGGRCRKCISSDVIIEKFCVKCKMITNHREACLNCASKKSFSTSNCEIHGEVLSKGGACCVCTSRKSMGDSYCEKCEKVTKHRGKLCFACAGKASQRKRAEEKNGN